MPSIFSNIFSIWLVSKDVCVIQFQAKCGKVDLNDIPNFKADVTRSFFNLIFNLSTEMHTSYLRRVLV